REIQIGVARYIADADRSRCECAIAVADGWQRRGLGTRLMEAPMAAARSAGKREMYGEVLAGNRKMLEFAAKLGFRARADDSDPRLLRVEKALG
ncbi:MAG: GNAT family N-acetyltransferase, partial [Burkholderiales bacterium]